MIRPLFALLVGLTLAQASAEIETWPVEMIDDADLHDVCHVGSQTVWAVGNRGAIWISQDAGKTWKGQPARTKATLSSVSFAGDSAVNGEQTVASPLGLIVGGSGQPFGLPSLGVVLRTTDGGASWQSLSHQLIPALHHVTMEDARRGTAVGDAWAMFPSALFRTSDAGRSWSSGPGRVSAVWTDADFGLPNRPLLVSRSGEVVALTPTTMGLPQNDSYHINAARWMVDGTALAVGDKGALLQSSDRGQTWHDHRSALPPGIAEQFNFYAMNVIGPHVWIAGSPGTLILRSSDAGRTWSAVPTGQTLPIHAMDSAVSDSAGAPAAAGGLTCTAVGALGLRLSSSDAGSQWKSAHAQQRRAGALIVAARATSVPLDLIAHLATGNGLRCRVAVLETDEATLAALDEAVKVVGGDGVTVIRGFEIPAVELGLSVEEIERRWQQQHTTAIATNQRDRGAEHLAQLVTRQIRIWRPELVFAAGTGEPGLDEVIRLTVAHAASKSGEPGAYPEHISVARLSPWRIQKALSVAPTRHGGGSVEVVSKRGLTLNPAEPLPALASSISAQVALARTHLAPLSDGQGRLAPPSTCQALAGVAPTTLLGDLSIAYGGESRRAASTAGADGQWLVRRGATHHNIQMLLARLVQRFRARGSAEQLAPLIRDLAPEEQSRLLFSIAQQFHAAGHTGVAMETVEGILRRQKDDAVHFAAALQKLKWDTSVEVHQMMRQQRSRAIPTNPLQLVGSGATTDIPGPSADKSATATMMDLKKLLRGLPPAARATEWVQMTEAAARRQGASAADRMRIYERLRKTLPNGAWRNCATTETWLANPAPDPRKPVPSTVRQIGRASHPPLLDGNLSEEFWQNAAIMKLEPLLGSRVPMPTTQVRFARDARYLYLAIQCEAADHVTTATSQPIARQRDKDLSDHDRVEISIDVNRDYSTGWRLTIDDRGWANDACERDASWDPQWHIARSASGNAWTIEAAMAWEEIVPPTGQDSVWLVGARRVVPQLGIATWPTCADARCGWESCGYLLTEQAIHQSP